MSNPSEKVIALKKVLIYLKGLYKRCRNFTGHLELNFKDGELKDIYEGRRTKAEEIEEGK